MQKKKIHFSIFAIIAGILIATGQTCLQYYVDISWLVFLAVLISDLLVNLFLLDKSFSYPFCFHYLLTVEILTLVAGTGLPFPYTSTTLYLFAWHLAVNVIFCTFRYLADRGPRFMNYNHYFTEVSILLWVALIAGFFYCYIYQNPALTSSDSVNLIPLYSLAGLIEDHIEEGTSLMPAIHYLLTYGAFFLPVGFYLHLLIGRRHSLIRLICFILFPALIEILQYFFLPSMCEIDDILPAFTGCIIGSLFFLLLNHICYSLHDYDFLEKRNRTSFYL